MSSESPSEPTLNDRLVENLNRLNEAYYAVESRVRTISPYIVRVIEVVLGVVLLAALAHWLHWVYVVGV